MEPKKIIEIKTPEQFEEAIIDTKIVFLFKHSTASSISADAKQQLETFTIKHAENKDYTYYIINILENRDLSNLVYDTLKIPHESPQLIVLRNKKVLFHMSHDAITVDEIEEKLKNV